MEQKRVDVQRPSLVTWLCVILFTAGIFNIIYSFTGVFASYGVLYSAANVLLIVILFAGLSGVWSMEKWGVVLFSVVVVIKLVLDLLLKAFHWWEFVLLLPVIYFWMNYKKMH